MEKIKHESGKIKAIKQDTEKLTQSATDFKTVIKCMKMQCPRELTLPTVHFMCGHVFCENCVEDIDGIRFCPLCHDSKSELRHFLLELTLVFLNRKQ